MAMYIPDKKLDESMNKLIAGKAKATANFNEYLNNIGI